MPYLRGALKGQLTLPELRKLVKAHNKLQSITIPPRIKRDELIKLIQSNGFKINHEEQKITPTKRPRMQEVSLKRAENILKKPEKTALQKQKAEERKTEREQKKKKMEREQKKKIIEEQKQIQKKKVTPKKAPAPAPKKAPMPKKPQPPKLPPKPKKPPLPPRDKEDEVRQAVPPLPKRLKKIKIKVEKPIKEKKPKKPKGEKVKKAVEKIEKPESDLEKKLDEINILTSKMSVDIKTSPKFSFKTPNFTEAELFDKTPYKSLNDLQKAFSMLQKKAGTKPNNKIRDMILDIKDRLPFIKDNIKK